MKNVKKLITILLGLFFSLVISLGEIKAIYANGLTTDEILLNANFSQETIDNISDYTKRELVNQIQSSIGFIHQEARLTEPAESEAATRSIIPASDLIFIITNCVEKVEGTKIKEIKVRIYYEWTNLPVWRLEDPILATWSRLPFSFKEGSFHSEDRYIRNGEDSLHVSSNTYTQKNGDTILWYADLKAGYFLGIGGLIDKLYGFGEFILNVNPAYQEFMVGDIEGAYIHSIAYTANEFVLGSEYGYQITDPTAITKLMNSTYINWQTPVTYEPADYGFPQSYFYNEEAKNHEFYNSLIDVPFITRRKRCGFIEGEYVVLSPRKEDAGTAYLVYQFSQNIEQIMVDLTLWGEYEYLSPTDSFAAIQYRDSDGNWVTALDLLNDITLSTDRNFPDTYSVRFPNGVKVFRFYVTSGLVGTWNKGRICIGTINIFLEY